MASKYFKTKVSGVLYREVERRDGTGKVRLYAIQYRDPDGKQHMEVVGRGDEGMTQTRAGRIRALKQTGKELPNTVRREEEAKAKRMGNDRLTLRKLWRFYDEDHADRKSRSFDAGTLVPHVGDLMDKTPEEIKTADIEAMKRRLANTVRQRPLRGEKKKLAPQTVAHVVSLIQRVLRYAVKAGYLPAFPAGLVLTKPRFDNRKTETLNDQQMAAYFHALETDPDKLGACYLRLILATGIRRTAAISLRWDDVISVNGGVMLRLRAETAKNQKEAYIPLNATAQAVLNEIPHLSKEYIFPGENGHRHRESFRKTAVRVKTAAGLPADWRPIHALRHSYASYLVSHGASLYEVQNLLTHGSSQMTQRYAHLANAALRKAAEIADGMSASNNNS